MSPPSPRGPCREAQGATLTPSRSAGNSAVRFWWLPSRRVRSYRSRAHEQHKPRGCVIVAVAAVGRGGGFTLEELFSFEGVEAVERTLPDGSVVPSLRVPLELAPVDGECC
jgi:hypothetical protein